METWLRKFPKQTRAKNFWISVLIVANHIDYKVESFRYIRLTHTHEYYESYNSTFDIAYDDSARWA